MRVSVGSSYAVVLCLGGDKGRTPPMSSIAIDVLIKNLESFSSLSSLQPIPCFNHDC